MSQTDEANRTRTIVARVAAEIDESEKEAIRSWMEQLLVLRDADLPATTKAKQAINLTASAAVVASASKVIAKEAKRLMWDDRGWAARLGLSGVVGGALAFGSQGAGIAALGTAIGVPLWVVFGAGAAFIGALYEELFGSPAPGKDPSPDAGRGNEVVTVQVAVRPDAPAMLPAPRPKFRARQTEIPIAFFGRVSSGEVLRHCVEIGDEVTLRWGLEDVLVKVLGTSTQEEFLGAVSGFDPGDSSEIGSLNPGAIIPFTLAEVHSCCKVSSSPAQVGRAGASA